LNYKGKPFACRTGGLLRSDHELGLQKSRWRLTFALQAHRKEYYGLGFYSAKKMIEKMGGAVVCKRGSGQGACFTVEFSALKTV
jgi:sensor histidine kinase regulating citrate/malate metabolism